MKKSANESRDLTSADVLSVLRKHWPRGDPEPIVRNLAVYQRAMVHFSHRNAGKNKNHDSYERLEFLGDAVLNLATASYLFERYPDEDEGFMTRMRTQLVNGKMLADLCLRHTTLSKFVLTGDSYQEIPYNIIEDVFEAFLGAIFQDSGFDAAKKWLVCLWESAVDFSELAAKQDGPKAILNRYCTRNLGFIPTIENIGGGNVHGVRISKPDGTIIATGTSESRKDAENAAILKAFEYYGIGHPR